MKQILQYLWIEKYGCIEKQGFNFTRRANIQFDYEAKKLTIEKNKDYCEDFFDDSIELSCIVGQNGVGKTTILRAIKEVLDDDYTVESNKCLVVYYRISDEESNEESNKKYHFLSNLSDEIFYDCNDMILDEKTLSNLNFIYYSDIISFYQYQNKMGNNELSTSFLLSEEFDKHNEPKDHVHSFFMSEFERQMDFLLDYKEKISLFNIKYQPFVTGEILINDNIFKDYIEKHNRNDKDYEVYKNFFKVSSEDNIKYFKECLARSIFLNIIYTFSRTVGDHDEIITSIIEFMENNNSGNKNAWDNLKKLLNSDGESNEYYYLNFVHGREKYISFIKFVEEEVKYNDKPFVLLRRGISRQTFSIALNNDKPGSNIDILTDIKSFFDEYRKAADFHNFISFSWRLSSGETSLLNIFSRLYSVKSKITNNTIVMLLDEIDVTLHPEWQRTIINELLKFLKYTFKDKYIQVIMTTHSPIMLSDIPKQNVLFLKNENGVKAVDGCDTFASNIFQLFSEGFFIGDTGIGVYAEKKLKEIVDHIHNNDIDDNELRKLIDAVGDTFLRNKLNEEYLMYRSQKNETEKLQAIKIAELETSKKQLIEKQKEERKKEIKIIDELLKKLESPNNGENRNRENIENEENRNREYDNEDVIETLSKLKRDMEEKL